MYSIGSWGDFKSQGHNFGNINPFHFSLFPFLSPSLPLSLYREAGRALSARVGKRSLYKPFNYWKFVFLCYPVLLFVFPKSSIEGPHFCKISLLLKVQIGQCQKQGQRRWVITSMVLAQIPHIIRSYRLSLRDRPLALCIIFEILQVGLKRIDAAIDALVPLGFSREVVRKTIKNLLKVMFYTLLGCLYCSVWHMISVSWI